MMTGKNYNSNIIKKMFWKLLPVQILIMMVSSLNGIIDGSIASNAIGPVAIAATGLFAPVNKWLETLNVVMMGGAQILCGQLLGKNQVKRTKGVFTIDMFVVMVISLIMTFICITCPDIIAGILGADGELRAAVSEYTRGIAPGFIAFMIGTQLSAFLQLEQQEKRTYIAIAVMGITNVGLDLLFVSALNMGMFGLGLATAISNWAFCVFLAAYYFTEKAVIRFDIKELKISEIPGIIKVGYPGAVTQFCQVLRGIVINHLIVNSIGTDGASAYAAIGTFGGIFFATVAGVAAATRLMTSVYIGEEDRVSLTIIVKIAITRGVLLSAGVFGLICALSFPLTCIFYRPEAEVVFEMTRMGFILFPISLIFSNVFLVFCNYYQCLGRMLIVNLLSVVDGVVGMAGTALILVPLMGMNGIWLSQILNGLYTLIIIAVYAWIKNKHIPRTIAELMTMPADFGVSEADRIDISIHNIDEVVNTSVAVCDFCKRHGIDNKHTMYAGLCVEEMAGNIVEHGFDGKKKHSIDIRVIYKPESLLIRIKDNCRSFNPKEHEDIFVPEDITHNIGIRMVSRIAKKMSYQNTLGLNVLNIEI